VRVEGDREHPGSRGFMCLRGRTILEHLYNKERINYPLKRKGKRGDNEWVKISWEKALDEIAEKLAILKVKYGAETLAFSHGSYRTYGWTLKRFFNLFGSPNIMGAQNVCRCPGWTIEWATFGGPIFPDFKNTKLIILPGSHFKESCPHPAWSGLIKAKKAGAKIIVIDPVKHDEAKIADIWLPIRPGTDVLVFLSIIKYIIENELYNKNFVNNFCSGFDKLKEHVQDFSIDKASNITGVNKDLIIDVAKLYAEISPAVIPWTFGIDKQGINANQAQRARLILIALKGDIDIRGGELFGRNGVGPITDYEMEGNEFLSESQKFKQIGAEKHKLMAYPGWNLISEAALKKPSFYALPPVSEFGASAFAPDVFESMITGRPYKVAVFFSQASNPIVTLPNPHKIYKALMSTELNVVMDYYMTPTAALADYVLPAASTLERNDIQDIHGFANVIIANPKAMEPLFDRRDDYFLWKELGIRLGQSKYWPWSDMEEALDYRLSGVGLTFKDLCDNYIYSIAPKYEKYKELGFPTPTNKVELYSTIFEKLNYAPLPIYRSYENKEKLNKKYPLTLITGTRFMPMYHSELRQIPSARKVHPEPLAKINKKTADKYNVIDNSWIIVENTFGQAKFKLKIDENMQDNMIHLDHGRWFPEKDGRLPELFGAFESNCNCLCPDNEDFVAPEIGSWPHTSLFCSIKNVE
jgi:anaerobic selenocysteine-containing dehydrogenase